MQEKPSEIAVTQISQTEYIMKCFHDMVDEILQKRIFGGNSIVFIGDFTFEIRTRAVRHVSRTQGNSRLNRS